MGQLFSLRKTMNFAIWHSWYGCIGWWQFTGFVIQMCVTFMCLTSLSIICHQMFYTFRLMTSGPTGFELACMFYLTRRIVMWRHIAIKCLFNGLTLFLVSSGITLFVKFVTDAQMGPGRILVINLHVSKQWNNYAAHRDITTHVVLAYSVLGCCVLCACMLSVIRKHHLYAFRDYYDLAKKTCAPHQHAMLAMSHRNQRLCPDT